MVLVGHTLYLVEGGPRRGPRESPNSPAKNWFLAKLASRVGMP